MRETVRAFILSGAVLLGAIGCGRSKSYRFADTEGRQFTVTCAAKGDDYANKCVVAAGFAPKPSVAQPSGTHAVFSIHRCPGCRYVAVFEEWLWDGNNSFASGSNNDLRAITCRTDTDCPEAPELERPSCMNGLCGDPKGKLHSADVTMLCLAGTGAWTGSERQLKALASVPTACHRNDPSCTPPPLCRQP